MEVLSPLAAAALLAAGVVLAWVISRSTSAAGPLALASSWAVLGIAVSGRASTVTVAAALTVLLIITALALRVRRAPGRLREPLFG